MCIPDDAVAIDDEDAASREPKWTEHAVGRCHDLVGVGEQGEPEPVPAAELVVARHVLRRDTHHLGVERLELARALSTQPKLLLLDEIAGGLTEAEVHALVDTIQSIRSMGVTIVWIEHIMHALLRVVDRMMAVDAGRKLIEGDPQSVMNSSEVRSVYLGDDLEENG